MKRDAQFVPATSGQILSIANSVETELCKLLNGVLSEEQAKKTLLEKGSQARIKQMTRAMARQFLELSVPSFPEKTNNLVLLSGQESLLLDACIGADIITGSSKSPFDWVDKDFANYEANEPGVDTLETEVGVYEMSKDANFSNLFGSFGTDLEKLCFTTSQIKSFVKKFKNWLRTDGYGTFFLFKSYNKFFVARVYFVVAGELQVYVYSLEDDFVWNASSRHRMVVPQF